MSIFGNTKDADKAPNMAKELTAAEQEARDEAAEKAAKEAVAKANRKPLDAHGNPMPDLTNGSQKR